MFDGYPRVGASIEVAAGATSSAFEFDELVAGSAPTKMFMRVATSSTDDASSASADPTIWLQAGAGDPTELRKFPNAVSIRNGPPGVGTRVASVYYEPEGAGVHRIDLIMTVVGSSWRIMIRNNDAVARRFTWVVADGEAETRQPWIDAAGQLEFAGMLGEQVIRVLPVTNRGTGDLMLTDVAGTSVAPGFLLVDLPSRLPPDGRGELRIAFGPPAAPGPTVGAYVIGSNDGAASDRLGHSKHVSLVANTEGPVTLPTVEWEFGLMVAEVVVERVGPGGYFLGSFTHTVTNVGTIAGEASFEILPLDATDGSWFSPPTQVRTVQSNESVSFDVAVTVPSVIALGAYGFHTRVSSVGADAGSTADSGRLLIRLYDPTDLVIATSTVEIPEIQIPVELTQVDPSRAEPVDE